MQFAFKVAMKVFCGSSGMAVVSDPTFPFGSAKYRCGWPSDIRTRSLSTLARLLPPKVGRGVASAGYRVLTQLGALTGVFEGRNQLI